MSDKYIMLRGAVLQPADDLMEWARWYETSDPLKLCEEGGRRVAYDQVGEIVVSTVFLSLDHNFFPSRRAAPLLFETMIFGGAMDSYQERYGTLEEAREGHQRALTMLTAEVCASGVPPT